MTLIAIAVLIILGIGWWKLQHPPMEQITKYPQLFATITRAMKTNGFSEAYRFPWDPTKTLSSITNIYPDRDTKFYMSGSYAAEDYLFMAVYISHSDGRVDFAASSQASKRTEQLDETEEMVRSIVKKQNKNKTEQSGAGYPPQGVGSPDP